MVAALGRDPTRHYRKGDIVSKRNPRSPVRKVSAWVLESPLPEDVEVHEHITWLCDMIAERRTSIEPVRGQMDIDIRCFWEQSGQGAIYTPASLSARLGELGLDVTFDIYDEAADW